MRFAFLVQSVNSVANGTFAGKTLMNLVSPPVGYTPDPSVTTFIGAIAAGQASIAVATDPANPLPLPGSIIFLDLTISTQPQPAQAVVSGP